MSQYDLMLYLKIKLCHCDLYFMVLWFCLISWRLFDVWTWYFGLTSQYDLMLDLKIKLVIVTYISWFSDIGLYLEDYFMYKVVTLAGGIREPLLTCSSSEQYSVHLLRISCFSVTNFSDLPRIVENLPCFSEVRSFSSWYTLLLLFCSGKFRSLRNEYLSSPLLLSSLPSESSWLLTCIVLLLLLQSV